MKTERVRDWMGAPLVGCPVDVEMADVARLLWDEGIRHAPLLRKNGRVAGVLSDIDVFSAGTLVDDGVWVERVAREPRELARPARAIVHPDDELALGLAALRDAGSDYALVLEADGTPVGILTEHDAVRAAARLLPEGFVGAVHRGVRGIDADTPVLDGLARMVDLGVRHLVVTRGPTIAG
ncbi:MAG: CBS domain-containing protein, partial [Myxococcales bacterium]|nr:CBS domain-containing protein [Myxococcales bacterium]